MGGTTGMSIEEEGHQVEDYDDFKADFANNSFSRATPNLGTSPLHKMTQAKSRTRMTTQQSISRPKDSQSPNRLLKDEMMFNSLISANLSSQQTPIHGNRGFMRSPRHAEIKKRVASQLMRVRGDVRQPSIDKSVGAHSSLLRKKLGDTDYISLNRRMSPFARTMGKEAAMGEASFRRHAR